MDVVGHQAEGEQAESITLAIMLQAFQVGDAVLVIIKSSLLLIAADNHMVKRSVILDSGLACHGAKTNRREDTKSILRPDPIPDPSGFYRRSPTPFLPPQAVSRDAYARTLMSSNENSFKRRIIGGLLEQLYPTVAPVEDMIRKSASR